LKSSIEYVAGTAGFGAWGDGGGGSEAGPLHAHSSPIAPAKSNRENIFMLRPLYNETETEHIATKMLHQQFH
jgi:hypothetical protein